MKTHGKPSFSIFPYFFYLSWEVLRYRLSQWIQDENLKAAEKHISAEISKENLLTDLHTSVKILQICIDLQDSVQRSLQNPAEKILQTFTDSQRLKTWELRCHGHGWERMDSPIESLGFILGIAWNCVDHIYSCQLWIAWKSHWNFHAIHNWQPYIWSTQFHAIPKMNPSVRRPITACRYIEPDCCDANQIDLF